MRLLEDYVRNLLGEMSRKAKIDHRENYNHPGLVKDALYMHWISGNISDSGINSFVSNLNKLDNIEDKKHLFLYYHIIKFEKALEQIKRGEELSCNLIDPDKSEGVGTNYSGDGIDPWGYFGFILKPKVVTMNYDTNVGVEIVDVGGGRLRKRTRSQADYYGMTDREKMLKNRSQKIRDKFPLEDEDAYKKSFKSNPEKREFFYYNESEFVIVPESIVGVVWLGGEFYHDETVNDVFLNHEKDLGLTKEELLKEKNRLEREYLKKFCNSKGIKFYETEQKEIFNIPRLQSNL